MAAEEDKRFDAVLGGFLLNDLRARAGNVRCPESDVLAAYHEHSLLAEEMHSWKEHIVGCARCQAVLAGLEATDSIPLRASDEASREEQAQKPALPASLAREGGTPAPGQSPERSRIQAISRPARWRWLAPAGALAAGLLVWVAWHEHEPSPWKAPAPVKTAKLEPPSPSQPQPPLPLTSLPPRPLHEGQTDVLASLSKNQAAADRELFAEQTRMSETAKQAEKPDARLRSAPPKPSAHQERARRERAASDLVASEPAPYQQAQDGKAGLVAPGTQTAVVQTEAANGQSAAPPSQLSAPNSAEPGQQAAEDAAKKSKAESRASVLRAASDAPLSSRSFNDVIASQTLLARDSNQIPTPAKKTLWRAGRAGLIAFSSDGGASWTPQSSNVLADLTAGSAPSETVCWIVGRAGTILLTTDAGSHWTVLHSPLKEDWGGVRATDALHATIWNLGNTKVLATADGGVRWTAAPSP